MKVLFATSEVAPFSKTGGLGDVAQALPSALQSKRVSTRVISPLYGSISDDWRKEMRFIKYIYVPLGWRNLYCGLFELKHEGVIYYFLDNEYYFKRYDLYGHFDDGERFAFFSKAVTAVLPELGWSPNVIHCNDWQTALIPVYLRKLYYGREEYDSIKTVFTIHNIEYQGRFGINVLEDVFGLSTDLFNRGTIEFKGGINLMKAAIELSDAVTTVSPTYARELEYGFYAHGLEGVIAAHRYKMSGILNGIDMNVFNPETDPLLSSHFSAENRAGKKANKQELQKLLGLHQNEDIPIIGMVSRLVSHKGLDLVANSIDKIMEKEVQVAVIGRGDWHFEQMFQAAQHNYAGRFAVSLMYNPSLANKIYAGSDMFLMPSKSEPCGLSQMIAMRYGTIPIVRETGGLKDTVTPYIEETGEGRGFTFANYNADDMCYVIGQAVDLYSGNKKAWNDLVRRDMELDFSWSKSVSQYMSLYREVSGAR